MISIKNQNITKYITKIQIIYIIFLFVFQFVFVKIIFYFKKQFSTEKKIDLKKRITNSKKKKMPKSSTIESTTPVVESTTPSVVKKVVKRRVSRKKKTEEKPTEELNNTIANQSEELNNTTTTQPLETSTTIQPVETSTTNLVNEEKPVLEETMNDVEEKPLEQEEEHIEDDEHVNNEKKKKKTLKKEDLCPKWDYLFEAYSAELKAARKQPNQNLSLLKYLTQLKNDTYKLLKLRRRKQESEKNSGFMKPVAISDELQQFFGGEKSMTEPITRVYITQKLCNYIKQMDLQNPEDKRTIIPDEKLKRLFQIGDDEKEKLTYYSIQQRIQRHIYKL